MDPSATNNVRTFMGDQSGAAFADKARGLLVGTAVGDGLGRPVEGMPSVPDTYIDEIVGHREVLLCSDDTILTIALVESLLVNDGFVGSDMATRFAEAWHAEPQRGYGANVVEVFRKVRQGVPYQKAASSQFGGEGSFGNGGAMRVAPVALWAYQDLEETVRLARDTAAVTHTHPVGIEGAVIQAVSAHHCLKQDFDLDELVADLDRRVDSDRFRQRLDTFNDCLRQRDDELARRSLGNGVSADRSVLTAVYCFVAGESFEDVLRRAISMGGDTDTIAAMAGAVAGARFGLTGIPDAWLMVEDQGRLVELADVVVSRVRG